jgi:hypothetical protein
MNIENIPQRPVDGLVPGRREAISEQRCMEAPIGCGRTLAAAGGFKDALSVREYGISGLCQGCQDEVFG